MPASFSGAVVIHVSPTRLGALLETLEELGYILLTPSYDTISPGKYLFLFHPLTDAQELEKTLEHLLGGGFLRKVEFLPS